MMASKKTMHTQMKAIPATSKCVDGPVRTVMLATCFNMDAGTLKHQPCEIQWVALVVSLTSLAIMTVFSSASVLLLLLVSTIFAVVLKAPAAGVLAALKVVVGVETLAERGIAVVLSGMAVDAVTAAVTVGISMDEFADIDANTCGALITTLEFAIKTPFKLFSC